MPYTIQSGDTLSQLAVNNKTTVADLMKSNPTITDANKIQAGASLNIPTKAPTGQTSVSSAVPVLSSNTAADDMNNRVAPGFQAIKDSQSQFQATKAGGAVYAPTDPKKGITGPNNGLIGYTGADGKTYPTQAEALNKKFKGGDGQYYATDVEAEMNKPASGHMYAYDQSGQRIEVAQGQQTPQGYSLTPPQSQQNQDFTESVDDSFGGSIRKMADGTYAQFNGDNKKVGGSNALTFNNLKTLNKTAQEIEDAKKSYTLSPGEQAQLDAFKNKYQKLIESTQDDYKNLSGAQSLLQNLYGTANSIGGQGAITAVVQKGIKEIASLTLEMEGKVAEMTQNFKDKNLEGLRKTYDSYTAKEKDRQALITNSSNQLNIAEREQQQQKATAELSYNNDIRKAIDVAKTGLAPASVLSAMQDASSTGDYSKVIQAGGEYLRSMEGWVGNYYKYVDGMKKNHPGSPIWTDIEYKNWDDQNLAIKQAALRGDALKAANAPGNAPYQATIDNLVRVSGSETSAKRTQQVLTNLSENGQWKEFFQAAKNNLKLSNYFESATGKELVKAEAGIPASIHLAEVLKQYQDMNGNMGYVKGSVNSIETNLGQLVVDPKFSSIATELTLAFQQYRNDMSGAAFSAGESASYEAVLPSAKKNYDLNVAVLEGMNQFLNNKVDNLYGTFFGQETYKGLKALAEKGVPKSPVEMQANAENKIKTWITNNPGEENQKKLLNWRKVYDDAKTKAGETPNDAEFLEKFGPQLGISFNQVGGDTKQAIIPQASRLSLVNNNPGNLRFAGQNGATQGEGGFAKFPSVEAGVKALTNQIRLDAGRGHTLATFINKFAPPTENDAKQYIAQITKAVGATPDTKLSQIDPQLLTKAMAMKESSTKIL